MLTGKELPCVDKGFLKSEKLFKKKKEFVADGISTFMPFFLEEAKDAVLKDVDGNIYLDFYGGIGVVNAGHKQEEVINNIKEQLEKYIHTCFMITPYEPYVELAKSLIQIIPIKGDKRVAFFNSGAEAVENAVKIARFYTKRSGVISFSNAFHGRTLLTMTLTSKVKPYKFGFGPFAPEIYKVPSAYCYRCSFGKESGKCSMECLAYIEEFFISEIDPSNIAAMIIEPVQGEGGFIVQPKEFIKGIEKLCKKYGIMLIIDEVQTGFSRTGKMFATEYYDIDPDIMTLAKSMASGMPLSAVVGKSNIMNSVAPSMIGGTYGGNPLACSAALATINYILNNNLTQKANEIGRFIVDRLNGLKTKYKQIGDVRGLGAMVAIEFVKDKISKKPAKELAGKIIKECVNSGLAIIGAGVFSNVIRFLPPLVITHEQAEAGMNIFEQAVNEILD